MSRDSSVELAIAAAALMLLAFCLSAWICDAAERADWRKWQQEKKQNVRGAK